MHQKTRDAKSASSLIKMAREADLNIDDELKREIMMKSGMEFSEGTNKKKKKKNG